VYAHWDETILHRENISRLREVMKKIIISPSSLLYNQTEQEVSRE
jgi:hypothetical protein